jgi:hypothetical protein
MTTKPNDVFVSTLQQEIASEADPQRKADLGASLVLGLLPKPPERATEADLNLEVLALEAKRRTAGPVDVRLVDLALVAVRKNLDAARTYRLTMAGGGAR